MQESIPDMSVVGGGWTVASDRLNPEERTLAVKIVQFEDMVVDEAVHFTPNTLCTYLFELAQHFNTLYAKHSILGEDGARVHTTRLALTAATAQILKDGLYLLGIETVERM